jgi:hypothetical protein
MSTSATLTRLRRGLHPRHVSIVLVAIVVEVGIRTTRLPRLTRLLGIRLGVDEHPAQDDADPHADLHEARRNLRTARAIDRVMRRWPFEDTCLRRALIVGFFIRRYAPTLLIGVRRDEAGEIAAHAWLVVGGRTLDPVAARYLSFGEVAGG